MKSVRMSCSVISLLVVLFLTIPAQGQSQENASAPVFSKEQLAQMLAPIALYPDPLLSQVLMASTYPIEVVEADRWIKNHPGLKGKKLDAALLDQDWDPSVKAICHFPEVLAQMSDRIGETTNIGNAFLAQEKDVTDMVQELRTRAYEQGNLKSSPEQKVVVEKKTIIIEPANPQVIYVPYYDPFYVYGPWWYPAYPPYYWGPSGVSIGVGISYWPGIFFGFSFGTWSIFDWPRHHIYINVRHRPRYVRRDRWRTRSGFWLHAPRHRRGVAYRDFYTARKYGQLPRRARKFGPGARGFPERRRPPARIERQRPSRQRQQARPTRQPPRTTRPAPRQAPQARPARPVPQQSRAARQRAEQERQIRERIERNIFNRVEQGRRERESSRRGSFSRGSSRGGQPRSRGPSGGGRGFGTGGGRGGRGRTR
ncbi:MAG: DUF3300 domain-containing protein [Deltaproteobacteria bacterium]|jgi:uncharacterized membrane protein YgcG